MSDRRDPIELRLQRFLSNVSGARSFNVAPGVVLGSATGAVRSDNQDRAVHAMVQFEKQPHRSFSVTAICDGMGGMQHGDRGATVALAAFITRLIRSSKMPPHEALVSSALYANDEVFNELSARGGATLSALMVTPDGNSLAVNAGDSRVYGIGRNSELTQLSRDDTFAGYLGHTTPHDESNGRLVQFVGMGEGFEPHIIQISPEQFGSVLLTTDGVHDVPSEALKQVIRLNTSNETALARKLIGLSDIFGGRDNATAAIIDMNTSRPLPLLQSLELNFITPFDALEVWIPTVALESSQAPLFGRDQMNENLELISDTGARPNTKIKRRSSGKSRTKRTLSRKAENKFKFDDAEKPDLNIEFPDDQGSKN